MAWETLKQIMNGNGNIEQVKNKEWILIKLISFGDLKKAERLNWYHRNINMDYIRALIIFEGKELKRFPKWISGKRKKDLIDNLIEEYFKKYNLSQKELRENYDLIRKIVESDLKSFLHAVGADEKTFKKLGIELKKTKAKTGLERWFE